MVGYYKHDIPSWRGGTSALSDRAYRVYHVIVEQIMLHEGPAPFHERTLAGLSNRSTRDLRAAIEELLDAGKISIADGLITNRRAGDELEAIFANRENSAKGGRTPRERSVNGRRKVSEYDANAGREDREEVEKTNDINDQIEAPLQSDQSLKEKSRVEKNTSEPTVPRKPRQHEWPGDYPEAFWRLYPRHDDKKAAMAALTVVYRSDKVAWQVIVDGIERLKACVEPRFHPYAVRWLKNERWTDEHQRQPDTLFGDQNHTGFAGRMPSPQPQRMTLAEAARQVMDMIPDDE